MMNRLISKIGPGVLIAVFVFLSLTTTIVTASKLWETRESNSPEIEPLEIRRVKPSPTPLSSPSPLVRKVKTSPTPTPTPNPTPSPSESPKESVLKTSHRTDDRDRDENEEESRIEQEHRPEGR